MTDEIRESYRLLELEPGASRKAVKTAYRELVKIWHPDRFPDDPPLQGRASEKTKALNEAYRKIATYLAGDYIKSHPRANARAAEEAAQLAGEQARVRARWLFKNAVEETRRWRWNTKTTVWQFWEACGLLEKEMRALEVRFKASEQALAASQARLESQKREFSDQQARIVNLEKEVSSRDAQLEGTAESLAQARAEIEQEKVLRLAAEQKSGELVAGLKSIEGQLAQQARHREQLLDERRNEQEQMRVCVDKVNAFCGRVTAILATREKQ